MKQDVYSVSNFTQLSSDNLQIICLIFWIRYGKDFDQV